MLIQIRTDIWVNPDHIVAIEREESSNFGATVCMSGGVEIRSCLPFNKLSEYLQRYGVVIVNLS